MVSCFLAGPFIFIKNQVVVFKPLPSRRDKIWQQTTIVEKTLGDARQIG